MSAKFNLKNAGGDLAYRIFTFIKREQWKWNTSGSMSHINMHIRNTEMGIYTFRKIKMF